MENIIRLKPGDDITSIVGYLWQTDQPVVVFDVPENSVFINNQIALKILKREVDRTDKEIIFVIKNPASRQLVQRLGFAVRGTLPKSVKVNEAPEAAEEETLKEVTEQDFETMLEREISKKRSIQDRIDSLPAGVLEKKKFSDIQPRASLGAPAPLTRRAQPDEGIMEKHEDEINVIRGEELKKQIGGGLGDFSKEKEEKFSVVWPIEDEKIEDEKEEIISNFASRIPLMDEKEEKPEINVFKGSFSEKKTDWLKPFSKFPKFGFGRFEKETKEPGWPKKRWQEKLDIKNFAADKATARREKTELGQNFSKYLIFFVGGALLIAAVALYLILPKVEIIITPKTETISANLSITADKSVSKIDDVINKIPAQLIKLDKKETRDFSATSQQELNNKAGGIIKIYNEYSSAPQTLVATTRFVSSGNKLFRLAKTITVPGAKVVDGKIVASSIEAEVAADQAGEEYNIGPDKFTIPGFQGSPKYQSFYGRSEAAMTGGAKGLATVVSQDDYNKAKDALWSQLQAGLRQELKAQLPAGLKLLDGAQNEAISSISVSPDVGERADKFSLTIKGMASALLFDENDLLVLSSKNEKTQAANKKADDKREFIYENIAVNFDKGQLSFGVKINQKLVWQVDVDKIKQLILGRDAEQIKEIFSQRQEIDKAKVLFWPFWVTKAPQNLDKIEITVEEP